MSAPLTKSGGRPNQALLSPPSSPEMESIPSTSRSGRWSQLSAEGHWQPWDDKSRLDDHSHVKQENQEQADSAGQGTPLALWHRQTLTRPPVHKSLDAQQTSQSSAPSLQETTRPMPSITKSETRQNFDHGIRSNDDDSSSPASDGDGEVDVGGLAPQTAAEIRAEKRKMKRFRLTHNQTRFLMSEYARQAHPDAAQRERLSREIPGLSPRQVQVWFQNRRAKLKRLTADDQESMLKSRALPLGFDTTQALHYMHDTPSQVDALGPSSFFHHGNDDPNMRRSKAIGRGWPVNTELEMISPASASTSFGDFYSTPEPLTSAIFSPTSPSTELSRFFTPPISQGTSPRTQVQDIRSRAGSLVSSMDSTMAHLVDPVSFHRSQSGGIKSQEQFGLYPQQTFSNHPAFPHVPMKHGEPRDSLQRRFTGYQPSDRSCLVNTSAVARRASDSVVIGGQSIGPATVPIQPLQSAPLTAPPDFLAAQQMWHRQFNEAGPPSECTYEQRPQNNFFWGVNTMIPNYQAEFTGQVSHQPILDSLPDGGYIEPEVTPKQEEFEGWNG